MNQYEELKKQLDENVELIINNMNRLHNHEELINKNATKIKENSYALSILKDYKEGNKRLFYVLIVLLVVFGEAIGIMGYLLYLLSR